MVVVVVRVIKDGVTGKKRGYKAYASKDHSVFSGT